MIQLLLKKNYEEDFSEVFPNFSNNIKLTKENPYFTQSGSYTLDVELPFDILENMIYFEHINRFEKEKKSSTFTARLLSDNKILLEGLAHITQISETNVKIQLVGGNSEVLFLSYNGDLYIDELDLGEVPLPPEESGVWDKGHRYRYDDMNYCIIINNDNAPYAGIKEKFIYVPIWDEADEFLVNRGNFITYHNSGHISNIITCEVPQMNLLHVLRLVVEKFGYHVVSNEIDVKPFNRLYIANAVYSMTNELGYARNKGCRTISKLLPHWTVKEFLRQIEYFFNVTIVFDSIDKRVDIIKNGNFFNSQISELETLDGFSVEVTEESEESEIKTLASSNLEYDLSDSEEHRIDCVSEEIEDSFEKLTYSSYGEMIQAMNDLPVDTRKKKIFCFDNGQYIYDPDENKILQINHFGKLRRSDNAEDTIALKIVPVATTIQSVHGMDGDSGAQYMKVCMPCVVSPVVPEPDVDSISVKEAIDGEENEKAEKQDRIEVFFMDDTRGLDNYVLDEDGTPIGHLVYYMGGWTDPELNRTTIYTHQKWSLSLRLRNSMEGISQRHVNDFSINNKAQYSIDCVVTNLYDVNQIFIIKNRKFVCEKFEYTIDKNGLQPIAKGYFYELL